MNYSGEHKSMVEAYPEGTLMTSGISKDRAAGGHRLGVLTIPEGNEQLASTMKSLASSSYSCVSKPIQLAAIDAYSIEPEITEFMSNSAALFQKVSNYAWNRLSEAGYSIPGPDAAYYLFPSLNDYREELQEKGFRSSSDIVDYLLNKYQLACLPGSEFGLSGSDMRFRLSIVDFDAQFLFDHPNEDYVPYMANISEGCNALTDFIGFLKNNIFWILI